MNAVPTSLQDESEGQTGPRDLTRRRRRRRTVAIVVVVAVAGAGVGLAVADPFGDGSKGKEAAAVAPTGLASVVRGRLSARTTVSGTLAYAGTYRVINQAGGVFTKLPHVGKVYRQGQVLYRVSGKPVVLLKGSATPLYRNLREGMSGADVRQLNAALADLGYGGSGLNSSYFGWATVVALEKLQDDVGLKVNGRLAKGEAVFMAGDKIRVTAVKALVGAPAGAGTQVLQAGSTTRQVTVALDASLQSQVKAGDKVTITLPNMKTTSGTVSSVGTIAKKKSSGGATLNVTIKPTDPKATGDLDQAPVGVSIVTGTVNDALSVPVNALLALLSGGYGVEMVDANGLHHLVPVTLGLFDNLAGTVQITGKGIAPGQHIVVPAS
jgi:peptidoglycan hydrolase-like protein with peptidoglycan-binding domain